MNTLRRPQNLPTHHCNQLHFQESCENLMLECDESERFLGSPPKGLASEKRPILQEEMEGKCRFFVPLGDRHLPEPSLPAAAALSVFLRRTGPDS
ncbi:hypothetical protein SKAU_G00186500 [Synaphobranchus kaupii]|uniref:Uncharacterized protein n=1 Tax=Synaphobranchus kaupii TaxID=118154 RepID=A0A9Q1IWG7_SYNKA|nr:hypothetical protein SKAU_G00186500 [Synaphobranchus kaupii]